jgi:uncharacterized membrane protein
MQIKRLFVSICAAIGILVSFGLLSYLIRVVLEELPIIVLYVISIVVVAFISWIVYIALDGKDANKA